MLHMPILGPNHDEFILIMNLVNRSCLMLLLLASAIETGQLVNSLKLTHDKCHLSHTHTQHTRDELGTTAIIAAGGAGFTNNLNVRRGIPHFVVEPS